MRPHPRNGLRAFAFAAITVAAAGRSQGTEYGYSWGHPTPQGYPIRGFAFQDANEGWAVAGGGEILHTVDAGLSWELLQGPLGVAPDLFDLVWTPQGALIACGTGDALYRSSDGGLTWTAPSHPAAADLRDLSLVPGGGVSAAGASGAVLLSTDDGETWSSVGPGGGMIAHHVWKTSAEAYVVGEGPAQRTTNGGASWTPLTPESPHGLDEVYFTDPSHGYINEDFAVWKTTDGGAVWTQHPNFVDPLYRFRTLVLSPQHWLLALLIEGGQLWETTDAGDTWTMVYAQGGMGFPCITQAPGGRVFIGSDLGDLLWTDDLGQTIENATTNLGGEARDASVLRLFTRPDGVIFAANQPTTGEAPAWLRSDDGGSSWNVPSQAPGLYWALAGGFFDNERGVVGQYELTRTTTDGGATWQLGGVLPANYRVTTYALPAVDRYFAGSYKSGGGGSLFRSTDGGASWGQVGGGMPQGTRAVYAVSFPTSLIGYATASSFSPPATLYKTTDGGATWQLLPATGITDDIRGMVWFDASVGLIAQSWQDPGIRRTTDGGMTWAEVAPHQTMQLVLRSATEAAALPSYGDHFWLTKDGGLTWETQQVPLPAGLPGQTGSVSAMAPTDAGWVVGSAGNRLLVATEYPSTSTPPGAVGTEGNRLAVLPNPARGVAEIRFDLQAAGPIELAVFDGAGARVARLFEGVRSPGSLRAVWTGKDDQGRPVPSGVYFARLTSREGARTAKIAWSR